jgi:hypothetical protein
VVRILTALQIFFVAEIFYIVVITLVKISILLFYVSFEHFLMPLRPGLIVYKLRVFPGFWFRVVSFATMAAIISSGLAIIFAIIFQCAPVGELSVLFLYLH